MGTLLQRPSLGEIADIGTLYNAREDAFLSTKLFSTRLPDDALTTTPMQQTTVLVETDSSYEARFRAFRIGSALAGSIITGSVDCRGAACFYGETDDRHRQLGWTALYYLIHESKVQLNFACNSIKDCLALEALQRSEATHVITGVDFGVRTVISTNYNKNTSRRVGLSRATDESLFTEMKRLKTAIEDPTPGYSTDPYFSANDDSNVLEVTAYSDVLTDTGIVLEDLNEAYQFLRVVPVQMKRTNQGNGQSLAFTLLPIEMLSMFFPVQVSPRGPLSTPPEDCLDSLLLLFDEIQEGRGLLNDYIKSMASKERYFLPDHIHEIESRLARLDSADLDLRASFPQALHSARDQGDAAALRQLLAKYTIGDKSVQNLKAIGRSDLDVADMLGSLVADGALYIGREDVDPRMEMRRQIRGDVYVLSFSRSFLGSPTWQANYNRFVQLLKTANPGTGLFVIHDNDARSVYEDEPHIAAYTMGQEITADLLDHEAFMSQRSFALCTPENFETTNIEKPVQRRFVTIPCPASTCSTQENKEWTCPHCFAAIEFGFVDDYIYCDCGRSKYTNYVFKCNGHSHGGGYQVYNGDALHGLLRKLQTSNYLNILILGETGVGKSTFINALVNYLQFETLDDALAVEDLNWVIPCSFSTQIMDRTRPNAEIVESSIQVGSRSDEKDGSKGDSATQQTTVYPINLPSDPSSSGYTTVRLIDTPGIGDTRGIDYDAKNMADILNTLSSYEQLHGILILLKSNAARLTITFQYCVKELLTHLHHSAAQNMVFGFTNTRISNYTPGDTFAPLKHLLSQNKDVGLRLDFNTTYCFDSESFRYLAAAKNEVIMPNKEDFDRSWNHSREETMRLVGHFRQVTPHETRSTMSLNGARRSITELTKPMADISQLIRTNIAVCEDQRVALKDERIRGDQLKAKLDVQKIFMHSKTLTRPRTVCAHSNCTEVRDKGTGNELVTVYKTHCHPECYIEGVPADTMAPAGLMRCAAFSGNTCNLCKHHWTEHLHVLYELVEKTETVKDLAIQQQIQAHASEFTLRQTALVKNAQTIHEYEQELETILKAAARFGVFLKKNSITPYNDATVAYLEFQIKVEQHKVHVGEQNKMQVQMNKARLEALQEQLAKHHEYVKVLTQSMNMKANAADISEAAIESTVRELYSLKHFGKMLEDLKHGIIEAHQGTYRERPHTVKRGNIGRTGAQKLQIRNQGTVYVNRNGNAYGGHGGGGGGGRQHGSGPSGSQKGGVLSAIKNKVWG